MQINTQRENKTVEYIILLKYGLELCITQLIVVDFFSSFFATQFHPYPLVVVCPAECNILARFLFSPSFAYTYPQSNKDYIRLPIFPFPSGNIYAPCVEQSSSSSLPLSLRRTGQRGEGSGFSAVYHQSYHSGW